MKKRMLTVLALLFVLSTSVFAFAEGSGNSLEDALNGTKKQEETKVDQSQQSNQGTTSAGESNKQDNSGSSKIGGSVYEKNKSFITGLQDASDLSAEVEGVQPVTSGLRQVVSFIVQVIAYGITILMALRVALDLLYITIPFTRAFLANGHQGNPQAGGQPGGMGMGMGGMGMGGMGMSGMGMGGSRYGGMGGMGMGMNNTAMANQQQGNSIQWVSNAALNAVASESSLGPNGKANNPFKIYTADMAVIMVIVPILLVLAISGALTNVGFVIAGVIVDGLSKVGSMM